MQLNVSEITSIYYHGIQNLVEAYKIFYGEMPDLENMESEMETRKRFQLMILILSEYNIFRCKYNDYRHIGFNDDLKMPYSTMVDAGYDFLVEKLRKVNDKQKELEQLFINRPLAENEKEGVKAISYIIKKQMEKERIEDPIEFLKQLCNVLYSRDRLIFNYNTKLEEKISHTMNYVAQKYQTLGYSKEMIIEKLNFICRNLCLDIDRTHCNCNLTRVIMVAKQDFTDEYESYLGLLTTEELSKKQRIIKMNNIKIN